MGDLKTAFNIVWRQAKQKREKGSVPVFLGPRGLLALMYDRIAAFSESEEDQSKYLLDLAVMAMFAFSTALPEEADFDEEPRGEEENASSEPEEAIPPADDPDANDPRWTAVAPNVPLPTAVAKPRGEEDND